MSNLPDNVVRPEAIAQEERLHRALFRKRLINEDTGSVKPEAFLRRRDQEGNLKEQGLSVDRASMRSEEDFAMKFRPWRGIVGLYAGEVRKATLEVEPRTEPPHDPSHAEIVGWPDDAPDAEAEEERLAGLLARQAKVLWLE